jgi:hypothetical protein
VLGGKGGGDEGGCGGGGDLQLQTCLSWGEGAGVLGRIAKYGHN